MANDPTDESRLSRDRDKIREWVDDHGGRPVRHEETGEMRILVEEEGGPHEEVEWDVFFQEMEDTDRVVVYHGESGGEPFEVVERGRALERTQIDDEEVEEALLEGETVTSHVTETTVVERTIVEEATVESEVVDRQVVEEDLVTAELLTRELVECDLTETGGERSEEVTDLARFDEGYQSTGGFAVEMDVDEGWSVTREQFERLDIESRITDVDVTETDEVEAESVASSVDIENVQRTILESDLLDTEGVVASEVIERGSLQTEFGEGDVIHTQLIERKTIDEEMTLRRRLYGEIDEGETTMAEVVNSQVVESEIVDTEEYDEEVAAPMTESETAGTTAGEPGDTGTTDEGTTDAGARDEPGTEPMGPAGSEAMGATEAEVADRGEGEHTVVSEDDQGKKVVDEDGEEIGIVTEVEGGTMYVDPDPSLADRIKAKLDWGDMDADSYPVESENIKRITREEVVLVSTW